MPSKQENAGNESATKRTKGNDGTAIIKEPTTVTSSSTLSNGDVVKRYSETKCLKNDNTTDVKEPTKIASSTALGDADAVGTTNNKMVVRDIIPAKPKPMHTTQTVTVQSINPQPSREFVDPQNLDVYGESLQRRMLTVASYVNTKANVYSIGRLLPSATWGRYDPFADHSLELCNPVTGAPLTVWVPGHIVATWFVCDGEPDKQASVTVAPLAHAVTIQTSHLIAKLSTPASSTINNDMHNVRAVKWQSGRGQDSPCIQNVRHTRVSIP
ncbi:hypothetical protein HYDPIDRAFT_33645 [Hydnomerulius pinastri MD-312]|uniref:Unplaced genomic scaffold scaffold_68, whole genome shotgun sequence n=1 Tax=Hydnomerulius pinastri MD-312 TaxID=994086 RepID=A0A0C9W8H3_9AGAM|nr:hypothetical protein HYDPIDRAFT_33645 [Hydnomerulius pinastri MD-312]